MAKVDFNKLSFDYVKADYRYVSKYRDGKWDDGEMTKDNMIVINECAGVLQYAQTCFEGLKAYETVDGKIVCFRPDLNAERLRDTCKRMNMPIFPKDRFVKAVKEVVKLNRDFVPPYSSNGSLYIRPFMFGSDPVISVTSAKEYEFRIFVTPVGSYFKNSLQLCVSDYDRAAPRGTGNIKAGLNYAMSMYPTMQAHENGFNENLYLDPQNRIYVEETGGANIVFVTKDGNLVTPKSDSILPSITKRSIIQVAKDYLSLKVEERKIALSEISEFEECFLCGTAAVVSPVSRIHDRDRDYNYSYEDKIMGRTTRKIYDTLTGIQKGIIKGPDGWIQEI